MKKNDLAAIVQAIRQVTLNIILRTSQYLSRRERPLLYPIDISNSQTETRSEHWSPAPVVFPARTSKNVGALIL